jgi:hypothetical protein
MYDWIYYKDSENRRDMFMREAENERLLREALSSTPRRRATFRYRLLAGIGRRFTTWGMSLQQRYSEGYALPTALQLEGAHRE